MVRFNPGKRHKLFTKNTQRIMAQFVYQSEHNFIYVDFAVIGKQNGWDIRRYFGDDFAAALRFYNEWKNRCPNLHLWDTSKPRQIKADFQPIKIL